MKPELSDCCVLNAGAGSWAFEPLAHQLSEALGVPISDEPRRFNYLLCLDTIPHEFPHELFVQLAAIRVASDKRLTAMAFERHNIPTPRTILLCTFAEVQRFVVENATCEWCLKFPTGCGAIGHQLVTENSSEPRNWPRPFIVQEFIRLDRPGVYRTYCAGGEVFGWIVRRFPANRDASPWVAHARGARYEKLHDSAPHEVISAATSALQATDLYDSFGCVDLLRRPSGEWLVLEVGTDGLFNHVDREIGDSRLEAELLLHITRAFWKKAEALYAAD